MLWLFVAVDTVQQSQRHRWKWSLFITQTEDGRTDLRGYELSQLQAEVEQEREVK